MTRSAEQAHLASAKTEPARIWTEGVTGFAAATEAGTDAAPVGTIEAQSAQTPAPDDSNGPTRWPRRSRQPPIREGMTDSSRLVIRPDSVKVTGKSKLQSTADRDRLAESTTARTERSLARKAGSGSVTSSSPRGSKKAPKSAKESASANFSISQGPRAESWLDPAAVVEMLSAFHAGKTSHQGYRLHPAGATFGLPKPGEVYCFECKTSLRIDSHQWKERSDGKGLADRPRHEADRTGCRILMSRWVRNVTDRSFVRRIYRLPNGSPVRMVHYVRLHDQHNGGGDGRGGNKRRFAGAKTAERSLAKRARPTARVPLSTEIHVNELLATPPARGSNHQQPNLYDVLVIGAGAAGIAAARRLHDAGRSVLVIEGRSRIGGRIHTTLLQGHDAAGMQLPPARIDLGASYLHGYSCKHEAAIAAAVTKTAETSGGTSTAATLSSTDWNPVQVIAAKHGLDVRTDPNEPQAYSAGFFRSGAWFISGKRRRARGDPDRWNGPFGGFRAWEAVESKMHQIRQGLPPNTDRDVRGVFEQAWSEVCSGYADEAKKVCEQILVSSTFGSRSRISLL
eukprot:SAG31_NODE_1132_length_9746_cov_6.720639_8_plen_567_part_00